MKVNMALLTRMTRAARAMGRSLPGRAGSSVAAMDVPSRLRNHRRDLRCHPCVGTALTIHTPRLLYDIEYGICFPPPQAASRTDGASRSDAIGSGPEGLRGGYVFSTRCGM